MEKRRKRRPSYPEDMDLKIYWTFLPHTDPDASLAFYRDILGFVVRNDVRYDGMAWLTLGHPDQPGTSLVLEPPFADPSITEDERRMIGEMMAKGTFSRVIFSTGNVDATFEQLQAAGVDVVQEPMDQPYGVRDCAVRDPAGNLIRINQVD